MVARSVVPYRYRAAARLGDAALDQLVDQRGQARVIVALPEDDVEVDVEPLVGLVELGQRRGDELAP